MPSPDKAAALAVFVGGEHSGRFVVGVSAGRLFLLLVVGSSTVGVPPIETPATAAALAEQTRKILA